MTAPPSPTPATVPARAPLPAGVWVLGFVSLLMDTSSEMIHSLLPVYLVVVLGAGATTVGLIEGVADATASITKVFSGRISDYLGKRKVLLLAGYGLAAASKPLFPLAPSPAYVLAARFIDRVGKGIRGAPRDALIADITPDGARGAAYGLRQALDTVGAITGPLIALALMAAFDDNFRLVFWWALAPAVLAVALIAFRVREPEAQAERPERLRIRSDELRALGRPYLGLVAVAMLFNFGRASEGFILLRAENTGLPVALVPVVLIVMNVFFTVTAYPAGRLSDRIGRVGVLAGGFVALVGAQALLAAADHVAIVFAAAALWGLQLGLTQGLFATIVADQAPAYLRGTAFGLFHLLTGVVMIPGNLLAGMLWDSIAPWASFSAGGALGLAALAALGWWWRRQA